MNKHDESSIANIADKMAGHDSFHIFEILITLGKACVEDVTEKRPEMVDVYMNLQNVYLSSETNVNNGMHAMTDDILMFFDVHDKVWVNKIYSNCK